MPKYYDKDCLKIFVCSLLLQRWFKFLEKLPILNQKCQFVQNKTNRQSWKFFKVKFWPNAKIQNSANTKPLNLELLMELACFIFTSWLDKCFEVTENIPKIQVRRRLDQVTAKNLFPQATLAKTFGTNWRNTVKLDKTSKMEFACF